MEQIQGIPHILDMLESIKKYLYVRNREQEAGHQRPDEEMLKSAPGIMFETGTDAYGYGICLGDQSLQWSRYHGIWTVDRIIRHRYSQLPLYHVNVIICRPVLLRSCQKMSILLIVVWKTITSSLIQTSQYTGVQVVALTSAI